MSLKNKIDNGNINYYGAVDTPQLLVSSCVRRYSLLQCGLITKEFK